MNPVFGSFALPFSVVFWCRMTSAVRRRKEGKKEKEILAQKGMVDLALSASPLRARDGSI